MDGFGFKKDLLRYNEIVETAFRYGRCGEVFNRDAARAGLIEAVEAASPDIPAMTANATVLELCPEWMCFSADPRSQAEENR